MSKIVAQRITAIAAALAFATLAVVLLLADRSVSVIAIVDSLIVDLGQTAERTLQIDVINRDDIPGSIEHFGHAALWGTGMLLFGWILRMRVPVLLTALFVAGTSVVFEAAQPVLSTNRRFETSDALANFTGIAAAVVFLTIVIWTEERRASRVW